MLHFYMLSALYDLTDIIYKIICNIDQISVFSQLKNC